MWRLATLLVVIAGCRGTDRVDSCADSLMGPWTASGDQRAPSGERIAYDFIEHPNGRLEVHAMFDDSVPPDGSDKRATDVIYAPGSLALGRSKDVLIGEHIHRRTKAGTVCTIKLPAKATCGDGQLILSWQTVDSLDWSDCTTTAAPDWRTVRLHR